MYSGVLEIPRYFPYAIAHMFIGIDTSDFGRPRKMTSSHNTHQTRALSDHDWNLTANGQFAQLPVTADALQACKANP